MHLRRFAARQGQLFDYAEIGGDGGSRFSGRIMLLTQEGFQVDPTVEGGHILRQFVTLLAFGRVERLSLLYVFLRSNRACHTQSQTRHRQPDTTIQHPSLPHIPVSETPKDDDKTNNRAEGIRRFFTAKFRRGNFTINILQRFSKALCLGVSGRSGKCCGVPRKLGIGYLLRGLIKCDRAFFGKTKAIAERPRAAAAQTPF